MKKLSIILIMLGIALSQNTKAGCKSTGIKPFDYLNSECVKELEKEEREHNKKVYKELMEKYKRAEMEEKQAKIQERQARYDDALAQIKRDNPNFKKPLPKQTPTKQKGDEITRDELIEYRRKTGRY